MPLRLIAATALAMATAWALPGCSTMPEPLPPQSGARLFADVQHYERLGIHRYGAPGAEQALDWIAQELRAAGLQVSTQSFTMDRQYEVNKAQLSVGGQVLDVLPQWWMPLATPSVRLSAPVLSHRTPAAAAASTPGAANASAAGTFLRLNIPFDRGAYLNDNHRKALQAAFARQPAAVLLTIDHPSAEVYTYNVGQGDVPWPVPVVLVAPKHRALLDAAEASGQPLTLQIDGQYRQAVPGRNVIGRLDRGKGRSIVISTPVTGWHVNTCERGPGIAGLLALARLAKTRFLDHDLVFVATAGHEIGHGGMEQFLAHGAPKPAQVAAWAHLGASLACVAWRQEGGRWVTSGQADASGRLLNASESMVPLVQRSFQGIEARRAVGAQAAVGELREVRAAGYPHFFGMAGLHTFFHTTVDTSAMTRPELLEPVIRAFADAIDGVGR